MVVSQDDMALKEIGITDALAGLVAEHLSGPALAEIWCQRDPP